jgi:hypothetical protein
MHEALRYSATVSVCWVLSRHPIQLSRFRLRPRSHQSTETQSRRSIGIAQRYGAGEALAPSRREEGRYLASRAFCFACVWMPHRTGTLVQAGF